MTTTPMTIPVRGGELRLIAEGPQVELQAWSCYAGGKMMRGGVRLGAGDIRLVLHALRTMLWDLERQEGKAA